VARRGRASLSRVPKSDRLLKTRSADRARWDRIALVLILSCVAIRVIAALELSHSTPSVGVWRFFVIATRDRAPYSEVDVEYPIALFGVFKALQWLAGSLESFNAAVIVLNVAADAATAAVLGALWSRPAVVFYFVATTPMVTLVYGTLDILPTLAVVLFVAAHLTARPISAGIAWSAGVFLKLWPGPFVVIGLLGPRRGRFALAAGVASAVCLCAWLLLGGIDGVRQVVSYRDARGWELGTIPGIALLAQRGADAIVLESGAARIGDMGLAKVATPIVAMATATWALARRSHEGLGARSLTGVAALLVFSTLLSPQFVWWLLPFAAIAWAQGNRTAPLLAASAAMLTGMEMARWEWMLEARGEWVLLIVLRNGLLMALLAVGLRPLSLRRSETRSQFSD